MRCVCRTHRKCVVHVCRNVSGPNAFAHLLRSLSLRFLNHSHPLSHSHPRPLHRAAPASLAPPAARVVAARATTNSASDLRVGTQAPIAQAFNDAFQLDPSLQPLHSWRGGLCPPRGSDAYNTAAQVVQNGMDLVDGLAGADSSLDVSDADWMRSGGALAALMGDDDPGTIARRVERLAVACGRIVRAQPSLVKVRAPTKIFGDVHGQLRDLLLLFREFGRPTHRGGDIETTSYVFNGDWVDRGHHQVAVVALLFALKIAYPGRIALVRGNHEFRAMNKQMTQGGAIGFDAACVHRLGPHAERTFETIHREVFDWLPLSALVGGSVLCLHGGIGDGSFGLHELQNDVPRPLADEYTGDGSVPDFVKQVRGVCITLVCCESMHRCYW